MSADRSEVLRRVARILRRSVARSIGRPQEVASHTQHAGTTSPPDARLPYTEALERAKRDGRVLHRQDIYGSGPPNEIPNGAVLDILIKWAGRTVLDVGCGIGTYTDALRRSGVSAMGIEVNAEYVTRARALGRSVQVYDGITIPFGDRSFDCVAAIEVLEHVTEWEALLREMVRVAARTVVISVPNIGVLPGMSRHLVGPWHLLEATHVNFFTRDILTTVLQTRFPDLAVNVSEYGFIEINGELFGNHLLAVLQR